MKKYVYIGIIAQLILTVFIFLSVIDQLELNKLLYKDKEKITILVESNSRECKIFCVNRKKEVPSVE
ncbi:hypothetical protein [Enterococcus lactis]|uniref:hypothetical protein n=1 Tax=Enterococcus lactis TaxID=357441 RepID=UPI001BD0610C|nr:hypothetical protein [Enterococcus lactis]